MSSQLPLKVAIIGTGIFAKNEHLPSFQKLPHLFKVHACYNRSRGKAEEFAKLAGITTIYESLEDAFKDPEIDVVDALLPVEYNEEVVALAVKYNKPLCFEKPIAATLAAAHKIVDLAATPEAPLIVVLEQWAYYKAIPLIKEKLERIGNVVSFAYSSTGQFNFNNKYLATTWRQKPKHVGGFLSDGGVHQLALLTGILGPVASVSARSRQVREQSGTDDVAYSLFTTDSGAIGSFTYGSAFGNTAKTCYFQILGDNGSIYYDFSPGSKPTVTARYGGATPESKNSEETIVIEDENFGASQELKLFGEALISGDSANCITVPELTFHHLAIVDAIVNSNKEGGKVIDVEKL
ncbi:unnamed protein product [Kuraishia capsulata CBS 1993]|uniref:Gfo/Idh/MocA-like oxidoreductase N-terminal domain-containing protein n=1 Tax=Kuraishia capsulata CBS 1993 TaxID=1382522 RepID=W6MX75_9ASCO|nr:uncharacterized protein KUCA_T00004382001 [Kuraishia capsulata CBS 1993]CDK28400.1 unnamed protein product [Kuraishia capsulata CBS 1993]